MDFTPDEFAQYFAGLPHAIEKSVRRGSAGYARVERTSLASAKRGIPRGTQPLSHSGNRARTRRLRDSIEKEPIRDTRRDGMKVLKGWRISTGIDQPHASAQEHGFMHWISRALVPGYFYMKVMYHDKRPQLDKAIDWEVLRAIRKRPGVV